MFKQHWNFAKPKLFSRCLFGMVFSSSLLIPNISIQTASAQVTQYCQLSTKAVQEKEKLRLSAFNGNTNAQKRYQQIIQKHAKELQKCRNSTWPQNQAIWLRLYPCDISPGSVPLILDRMVNRGYNQVYLEVFADGQVLLPKASNSTVWPSRIRNPGTEKIDLLAYVIKEGRQRGLKVYAWMYTVNFGYTYAQIPNRAPAIARNGKGQTSLYLVNQGSQVFVDPYNNQARADYSRVEQEILRRRPDGILFDYVRYPRQSGSDSVASKLTDLWLFSAATQEVLLRRALNYKGLDLIRRFLTKGYITAGDITEVDQRYPQEGEPLWQGRNPPAINNPLLSAADRQAQLQSELWQLSVAHAMQGILDFVSLVTYQAKQASVPAGVVFFPEGNQMIGQGYDSRLQPWDRFSDSLEWHPMLYATCGNVSCIMAQLQRVLSLAKPNTKIMPALAGNWGQSTSERPSLEAQMQALRQFAPRIKGVSHFAYSWQYPQDDVERKTCQVR